MHLHLGIDAQGLPSDLACHHIVVNDWDKVGFFPGVGKPLGGLYCCGDSTFPGIGLPAVAASGMIAANTLAPVQQHLDMLREIGCIR